MQGLPQESFHYIHSVSYKSIDPLYQGGILSVSSLLIFAPVVIIISELSCPVLGVSEIHDGEDL